LATFANMLAWIAERAPWVAQGIMMMMLAHRIYGAAVGVVNGLIAVAIGVQKAYRAALILGAAVSRGAAAAALCLRGSLLGSIAATVAHGAAMTVAAARTAVARTAMLVTAAASYVLSGALFRTVGAA